MTNAYQHNQEYLLDELQRIDLMLQHRIAEMQSFWRKKAENKWPGFYISDEEVNQILEQSAGGAANEAGRPDSEELRALSAKIREREQESLQQGLRLPARQLAELFRLSAFETQTLFICLAPELDLKYQKLYAYAQDDITKKAPATELVLNLLCRSLEEKIYSRRFFLPQAPLLKYELLDYAEPALAGDLPLPARALKLNDRITEFLLGFNEIDNRLNAFARLLLPQKGLADLVLGQKERIFFSTLAERYRASSRPASETGRQDRAGNDLQRAVYYFYGPYGSGKKATAGAVCRELGIPLLWVNLRKMILQESLSIEKAVALIFRESLLMPCAVYLEDFDLLLKDEDPWPIRRDYVLKTIEELSWLTFLSGRKIWAPPCLANPFLAVPFPVPDYELRQALWQVSLNGQAGLPGLDLADLADKFKFTAGQIRDAGATAVNEALQKSLDGGQFSSDDVYAACRIQSNQKLSALAVKLKPLYTWKDIVLPQEPLMLLNEIIAQVKHHKTVYYQWGFDRKLSLGKGLNIIFSGPSGTGKTMAAEIIANALSLDLYKIDLSLVVSKYIGETEKNLSRIFEEAATSNGILFFDEADALFGKRSEVRDSHDRYANIEIGYLLQKMEEHSGMVILATNLRKNMDEAFMRRMHFCIDFPFPDEDQREKIWRRIFPDESPLAKNLDYKFLSERLKLAGGNIKNIAVTAAFYAAGDETEIKLRHIMLASKREYRKIGKMFVKEDFEPYGELT